MKTNQNPADKITVYTSGAGSRSVWRHLAEVFREFPQAHELGYRLFKRNIKAQYRQSFLGFGWALNKKHKRINGCYSFCNLNIHQS